MNFAEQLTFWYLRLNGFFPITNFVLHHEEEHRTSDADLLAVRFPHVSEDIGGTPDDWDERFLDKWDINLTTETIGVMVEVKSGHWNPNRFNNQTPEWRVRDALRRMGMLSQDQVIEATDELCNKPVTRVCGFTSMKLFIGNGRISGEAPWFHVELDAVDQFVCKRMSKYYDRKSRDRLFFEGDLIQ
jgi:hypothetical protein